MFSMRNRSYKNSHYNNYQGFNYSVPALQYSQLNNGNYYNANPYSYYNYNPYQYNYYMP